MPRLCLAVGEKLGERARAAFREKDFACYTEDEVRAFVCDVRKALSDCIASGNLRRVFMSCILRV